MEQIVGFVALAAGLIIGLGAAVRATVLGDERGRKLIVFKYKRKNRYQIKTGHRQTYTRLRIEAIEA